MSAAEAARGVSSFLVPHQSSEDLVALGPALVALTLGLTLFFAGIIDAIDGDSATMSITDFLFQHLWDPCNEPLGLMALIFWCSVFLKVAMIILWDRFQNIPQPDCCTDCCNANFCRCLTRCFYYCLALPIVFFEFAWPITTLILLLLTKSCTWQLEASTWVVMSPFILEAFGFFVWLVWLPCLKPIFWCMGLWRIRPILFEAFNASDTIRRLSMMTPMWLGSLDFDWGLSDEGDQSWHQIYTIFLKRCKVRLFRFQFPWYNYPSFLSTQKSTWKLHVFQLVSK